MIRASDMAGASSSFSSSGDNSGIRRVVKPAVKTLEQRQSRSSVFSSFSLFSFTIAKTRALK